MIRLTVQRTFDAAHFVVGYRGKCGHMHGHTWRVSFTFAFKRQPAKSLNAQHVDGMYLDFNVLKNDIDLLLPDHKTLNKLYKFNPTAENLAKYFYDEMKLVHREVVAVEVWEGGTSSAKYTED